jgi:hypothetical protein
LFEQFQKIANFYFLINAILSLTPYSPKPPSVSIAPLVFVLLVSAVKEAFEDYASYFFLWRLMADLNFLEKVSTG